MWRIISDFIWGVICLVGGIWFLIDGDIGWGIFALVLGAILLYYGYKRWKKRKGGGA